MRRLSVLTIFLPGMIAVFAVAAPASGQNLREALALAYKNNPTLEAQRAQLRATDEGVPRAMSGWRACMVKAAIRALILRAAAFSALPLDLMTQA